jgi:hypothetical protein
MYAPEALSDWTGREITVETVGAPPEQGGRYRFDTHVWLLGESLAVQAVGQQPAPPGRDVAMQQSDPVQALRDRDLQEHVRDSDLIVHGVVSTVRLPQVDATAAGGPAPTSPVTEHDPQTREAVINVNSVEKGTNPGQQVVVHFPASTDVAWYFVPKLKPGDQGVFLLHSSLPEEKDMAPAADYAVRDPLDFQPEHKLEQIRTFVRS